MFSIKKIDCLLYCIQPGQESLIHLVSRKDRKRTYPCWFDKDLMKASGVFSEIVPKEGFEVVVKINRRGALPGREVEEEWIFDVDGNGNIVDVFDSNQESIKGRKVTFRFSDSNNHSSLNTLLPMGMTLEQLVEEAGLKAGC